MKRIIILIPLFLIIMLLSVLFMIVLIENLNLSTPKLIAPLQNILKTGPAGGNVVTDAESNGTPAVPPSIESTATPTPTSTPLPSPTPFPEFFGCEMEMAFTSGPLEGEGVSFQVLGEDYFADKGDRFDVGKNTAVYYQGPRALILHSGFDNGNIFKPLEAEFIRSYLEAWGNFTPETIQNRMESLNGSSVEWYCNQALLFRTKINFIVRLSHDASNRLWLEPDSLTQILEEKEGESSEWLGEILWTEAPYLYLNFCGWGPWGLGEERYVYYRYLINFEILPDT
jgi:hypothetical protein